MATFRRTTPIPLLLAAVLAAPAAAIEWPSLGLFNGGGAASQPGTPDWWDKHKNDAVHEPGKGYRVPGFEGFFDGEGRRMDAPVDEVVAAIRAREEAPGGLLPNLDPKRNVQRVRQAIQGAPDRSAAAQALAEGRRLYDERRYDAALSALRTAAQRAPGSKINEEAQFLIAECYFREDRYVDARDEYDRLVSDFPSTTRLDEVVDRQWRIANYWRDYHLSYHAKPLLQPNFFDKTRPTFDTLGQAIKTYDSIRLNDPTGPRADDAVMQTAAIYFGEERYEDADYHYTLLRENYPRSEMQFEAHLLGLQTKLLMYQGPDYDAAPLEDAKKLARRIRTSFAGRLSAEEKERLKTVDAQLQQAVEQRDLRMASYYDNVQQYGAARRIYSQIAQDYPGSPIGQRAAARLAELGGLPAEPEKPLKRFVEWFPENREQARFANIPEVRAAREATRLANNPAAAGGAVVPATATAPATAPTTQR